MTKLLDETCPVPSRATRAVPRLVLLLLACLAMALPAADAAANASRVHDEHGPVRLSGRVQLPEGHPEDDPCSVVARGEGGAEVARVLPGPSGSFVLELPHATERALLVLEARHACSREPTRWRRGEAQEGFVLEGDPAGVLELRFQAPTTEAARLALLAGARLRLNGLPTSGSGFGWERVAAVEPGPGEADGPRAVFVGLPIDHAFELEASIAPWVPFRRENMVPRAREVVVVDIVLEPGTLVRGRVVDERGRPVDKARIDAFSDGLLDILLELPGAARRTGPDGTWEISGVPAGALRLAPVLDGYIGQAREVQVAKGASTIEGVDLVLADGVVLRGEIALADGRPAPHAIVRWTQKGAYGIELAPRRSIAADEAGRFRIGGLVARPIRLEVEHAVEEGGRRVVHKLARELVPGREELKLELAPTFDLRGHVVDDRGMVVQRFQIAWTRADIPATDIDESQVRTKEVRHKDGLFELDGLESGPWRVWILARQLRSREAPRVELPGFSGTLLLVGERRGKLGGVVQDSAGAGVPAALVEVSWTEPHVLGIPGLEVVEQVRAGADGRFELDAVGPGKVRLRADMGAKGSAALEVELATGATESGVVLRATP